MTLPRNVKDAVKSLEREIVDPEDCTAWQTIRAHLLSQEAEIDRLRNWNERVSVCRDHTVGIVDGECLVCRLAAANAQLRLMHRVLSQAVCVACADDGSAKDHELDKLEGVLRDQGWITSAVVPSTPTDAHLQGSGDEA